ncbi:MAG: SIMPL domain-containing protein [Prevotellaceae bacterium]|jgi:uncharacterized protein YggE|nr:SIMPL domain-containing protein [Prevotellaceae bacterium]
MKKALFLAAVAMAMFATAAKAQSGEKNFIDQPYIEVTGRAEKEVIPDEIYLKIVINENDNKAKQPLEQLESKMIAALSKLGINVSKDLAVKDLSSSFRQYWYKSSDIFASKEYQLLVSSAAMAGKALQELELLGISNISIAKVDHSEIEKLRREVKISAMKDAKSKAADLLQAIDHKVGRALWVQEVDRMPYRASFPVARAKMLSANAEAAVAQQPEVEFEKIKLEYTVTARFAIEP